MSVTLDTSELVGTIAGSSLLGSLVPAIFSRRRDNFAVYTAAYEALADRVTKLEVKLALVETERDTAHVALNHERDGHEQTKSLLRIALEHVRAVITWGDTDRTTPIPTPPHELVVRA